MYEMLKFHHQFRAGYLAWVGTLRDGACSGGRPHICGRVPVTRAVDKGNSGRLCRGPAGKAAAGRRQFPSGRSVRVITQYRWR